MNYPGAIYIAGPMRGIKDFNFPAFHAAEQELLKKEYFDIYNPAWRDENQYGKDFFKEPNGDFSKIPPFNLGAAMATNLDWICNVATEMLMLPGWEKSKGATLEHDLAKYLGLKITYL
jgi:hypothetical protein